MNSLPSAKQAKQKELGPVFFPEYEALQQERGDLEGECLVLKSELAQAKQRCRYLEEQRRVIFVCLMGVGVMAGCVGYQLGRQNAQREMQNIPNTPV